VEEGVRGRRYKSKRLISLLSLTLSSTKSVEEREIWNES